MSWLEAQHLLYEQGDLPPNHPVPAIPLEVIISPYFVYVGDTEEEFRTYDAYPKEAET